MKTIINVSLGSWRRSFLSASLLLVCVAGSMSAQPVKTRSTESVTSDSLCSNCISTGKFWSHWFIDAGGGGRIYFGDHNRQMKHKDRPSAGAELHIGKWWSPVVGTRIGYSFQSVKGVTQNGSHSTGHVYDASQNLTKQKFNVEHIHGDVLFNVSNLLCGVNENRFYSLSPYVGLGWMYTRDVPKEREVSANIGLLNSFRLSKTMDLTLDIRGAMVNDRFDGEVGGRRNEGLLSANLGLIYHFGGRNWSCPAPKRMNESELTALRDRIAEMNQQNASLRNKLSDTYNQPKEIQKVTERIESVSDVLVIFPIGKSTLSQDARVNIGFMASLMKKFKDSSYIITGYADDGTGNPPLNDRLSRDRAEAVKNCLVREFGINASRLKTVAAGGVGNKYYNNPALSRAVIVSPNK
ncbi:MAG: OmpA family protein [Dysgonamonadaceae bacterium]|nr:OmpA family protein [Dysgonamonadaceae bacterium]